MTTILDHSFKFLLCIVTFDRIPGKSEFGVYKGSGVRALLNIEEQNLTCELNVGTSVVVTVLFGIKYKC